MAQGAREHETDDELFLMRWEAKTLSLIQKKRKRRTNTEIIVSSSVEFDEIYVRLKSTLELELAKRVCYLRYDALPEVIPDEAIIDMNTCEISEDVFFTSEELFILCGYERH